MVDPIVAAKSVSRRKADAIEAATSADVARNARRAPDRTDERCATAPATEPATHTASSSHTAAVTSRPREPEGATSAPSGTIVRFNDWFAGMARYLQVDLGRSRQIPARGARSQPQEGHRPGRQTA